MTQPHQTDTQLWFTVKQMMIWYMMILNTKRGILKADDSFLIRCGGSASIKVLLLFMNNNIQQWNHITFSPFDSSLHSISSCTIFTTLTILNVSYYCWTVCLTKATVGMRVTQQAPLQRCHRQLLETCCPSEARVHVIVLVTLSEPSHIPVGAPLWPLFCQDPGETVLSQDVQSEDVAEVMALQEDQVN